MAERSIVLYPRFKLQQGHSYFITTNRLHYFKIQTSNTHILVIAFLPFTTKNDFTNIKVQLHQIASFTLYLPSIVLHYTSCPKAAQNSKLINAECRPFHEDYKTKLITYKQQTKQENKKHIAKRQKHLQSFMMTNYPLFWHFLVVQIHATLHPLRHSIIQMFISPLFEKCRHIFWS